MGAGGIISDDDPDYHNLTAQWLSPPTPACTYPGRLRYTNDGVWLVCSASITGPPGSDCGFRANLGFNAEPRLVAYTEHTHHYPSEQDPTT